jgi:deoxyribonuclease V
MKARDLHPWDVTPQEAIRIQSRLRGAIIREGDPGDIKMIAGVDISVKDETACAAVLVLTYPRMEPVEEQVIKKRVRFPYIPGLLSFRETPAILEAFERLRCVPDLIIVDGQGIAHPRRLGIASHLGLLLEVPTIGCAKTRLLGQHPEPDRRAGCYSWLMDGEEIIGAAVRTKDGTKPVYVSVGHKLGLESAIKYVLGCCRGYRLPEPTRLADILAGGGSVLGDTQGQLRLW